MKNKILLIVLFSGFFLIKNASAGDPSYNLSKSENNSTIVYLTNESFKKMVFNYEVNKVWKYEGTKPAIIDFYADWCGPCRQLAPVIEQISKDYAGKIIVYKVDTDKETLLSQTLGITSLPTLLFIPAKGSPQASMGALPKESLVKIINEVLLVK